MSIIVMYPNLLIGGSFPNGRTFTVFTAGACGLV